MGIGGSRREQTSWVRDAGLKFVPRLVIKIWQAGGRDIFESIHFRSSSTLQRELSVLNLVAVCSSSCPTPIRDGDAHEAKDPDSACRHSPVWAV